MRPLRLIAWEDADQTEREALRCRPGEYLHHHAVAHLAHGLHALDERAFAPVARLQLRDVHEPGTARPHVDDDAVRGDLDDNALALYAWLRRELLETGSPVRAPPRQRALLEHRLKRGGTCDRDRGKQQPTRAWARAEHPHANSAARHEEGGGRRTHRQLVGWQQRVHRSACAASASARDADLDDGAERMDAQDGGIELCANAQVLEAMPVPNPFSRASVASAPREPLQARQSRRCERGTRL